MKRQEIEAKLVARALADETFRKQLIEDPMAAIENVARIKIQKGAEVEVLQETGNKFYIVLPAPAAELSEQDLEAVAGGTAGYQNRRLKNWHSYLE